MADIAKAYVQIVPSAEGIKGSIENMLGGEAQKAGESAGSKIGSGMSKALGTAAKVGAAAMGIATSAVGAASTAVGAVAKQSVDAYANFEQLEGGIKTLFGSAAPAVMKNAEKAFESAGQSMNDYMEISIQSAAALIKSCGEDQAKAAELMDVSIVDMADNVNKMGTSMEGVQNAYRGFSRGNFTMLDNLAMGFAGTKEGMQQLLEKAQELSGVEYDIESYSDIVQAIHVVQKEMGIAGTTAAEGAETISGSLSQLKGAWTNLITGLANPDANMDKLINDVVNSAEIALKNLMPAIEKAIQGVSSLIGKMAPIIAEKLPVLVETLAPSLMTAGKDLIVGLANALRENLDTLLFTAGDLVEMILQEMVTASENGDSLVLEIITSILGVFEENYMQFMDMGMQIMVNMLNGIAEKMPDIIFYATEIISHMISVLSEHASELVSASIAILNALVTGIADNIDTIAPAAVDMLVALTAALLENTPLILECAVKLVVALCDAIIESRDELLKAGPQLMDSLVQGVKNSFGSLDSLGAETVNKFIDAIQAFCPRLIPPGMNFIINIIQGITKMFDKILGAGEETVDQFGNGIEKQVTNKAEGWGSHLMDAFIKGIELKHPVLSGVINSVANLFYNKLHHTHPENGPLADDYTWMPDMMDSFAKGISDNAYKVDDAFTKAINFDKPEMNRIANGMYDDTNSLKSAVWSMANDVRSSIPYIGNAISGSVYSAAVAPAGYGDLTIPVYIGQQKFATAVVNANQINNYRAGGR